MDAVQEFFDLFNTRDFDALRKLMGPGYSCAEPLFPEHRDADAHIELMKYIAQVYPNRWMDVNRRIPIPGADGAAVEATWAGRPAGGDTLRLERVFAFEVDSVSGTITRLRGYYEPPEL
jgi:hypothetical protein